MLKRKKSLNNSNFILKRIFILLFLMINNQINISNLHPLIHLTYWTPFPEVKRDSAAAFAALSCDSII